MNILTFDIEEWFHILDEDSTKTEKEWSGYESRIHQNTDRIFELLERKKQKATFFFLGWIARKYPEIVKKANALGFELGSHSNMHQLVYEQSAAAFKDDVEVSVKTIEDLTGKKVRHYRAPGFSIREENKWAFEILLEHGIETDSSIFPAKRAHGGFENFGAAEPALLHIGGASLKEFPINFYRFAGMKIIFSGGGYFRAMPYSFIRKAMQKSAYVMTYFHPRDFDPHQPMLKNLPLTRKFKSYCGLKGALTKLEKLLDDFQFTDLQEAEKNVDWETAREIII